jgi:putative Ca2+/H+ antiporter (TMEM165/GDT1 family)
LNFKLILVTFGALFLAELGDKTQLAVISLSAQYKSPFTVFIGASLALVLVTLIGAYAGGFIVKYVPVKYLHVATGTFFMIVGISILYGALKAN